MAERDGHGRVGAEGGRATAPEAAPVTAPGRWGPASYWRLGLLALLALLIGLALAGGAFWTATPVETPR